MKRALLVLVLLTTGCIGLRDLFRPYGKHPEEVEALLASQTPMPHYDAALVLGCPANPDGTASPCERCRVKSAVRQFRRGHVGRIIFSGGAAHSPDVEADVMGDLAVRRGVPPADVIREGRALTTWQNVRFSLKLIRTNETVLVISTADHLPRARRIARFWGLDDARTRYFACDRDMPMDSDAEFAQPPPAQPPTKTNG